jgi:HYR domain
VTGHVHLSPFSSTRTRRVRLLLATALTGSIAAVATQGAAAVGVTQTTEMTPPSFSDVPPVVVVRVNGVRKTTAEYQEPLAYDASGSSLPVTCSPPSGSIFGVGDTDVTCSATDSEGTAASVSFVVRVLDTVPPPAATDVVVWGDKNRVSLTWRRPASTDIAGTEILRYPGAQVIFRSTGTTFVDTDVQAGAHYRYRVASYDWADNHSKAVDVATTAATASLIQPQDWANLTRPPLLAWAPVAGADYYNVQLWAFAPSGLKKVLSIWPASTHLQLPSKWVFGGQSHTLTSGRYRWYVWPGLGPQELARYGNLMGSHTFVIGH